MAEIDAGMSVFQFRPESSRGGGGLGVATSAPRMGVQGGDASRVGVQSFLSIQPNNSNLPAFLADAFAPKIKAQQQEAFRSGYTRAINGASQEEINSETPWYTKIFGPVPYQLGAETYRAEKAVADVSYNLAKDMPRLRTMDAEAVSQELWKTADGLIGDGDQYTAALITKKMMDTLPGMMNLHAKQRYAWEQEQLVGAQTESDLSNLAAFEEQRKGLATLGHDQPDQVAAGYARADLQRNLLASLASPEYQDPDSVKQRYRNTVMRAADKGYFSGIAVLMEAGLDKYFDPADVQTMRRYVDSKWEDFKDNAVASDPDLLAQRVKINVAATQGVGGEKTIGQMQAFDQSWQAKFGYLPYFGKGSYDKMATTSTNAWVSNEEQALREAAAQQKAIRDAQAAGDRDAAKEAAKEKAKNITARNISQSWMTGQKAMVDRLPEVETKDKELGYFTTYQQAAARDPVTANAILVQNTTNAGPASLIKEDFQTRLAASTGGPINDSFRQLHSTWSLIHSGKAAMANPVTGDVTMSDTYAGPAASLAYFGAEADKRMQEYSRLTRTGVPDDLAYSMSWGDDPKARPTIQGATAAETKQMRKDFSDGLAELDPSWWARNAGYAERLTKNNREKMARYAGEAYGALPNMAGNNDQRVKYAIQAAKQEGVEIAGRFLWDNNTAQGRSVAQQALGLGDQAASPIIDRAIAGKIASNTGIKVNDDTQVDIIRGMDRGGEVVLRAAVLDKDMVYRVVEITGKDMQEQRDREAKQAVDSRKATPTATSRPIYGF